MLCLLAASCYSTQPLDQSGCDLIYESSNTVPYLACQHAQNISLLFGNHSSIQSFVRSIDMCGTRWFLAVLRIFFHSSLLYTLSFHPFPPTSLPSSLTSSCHPFLGLPFSLVVSKFIYNTFLEILFQSHAYSCSVPYVLILLAVYYILISFLQLFNTAVCYTLISCLQLFLVFFPYASSCLLHSGHMLTAVSYVCSSCF